MKTLSFALMAALFMLASGCSKTGGEGGLRSSLKLLGGRLVGMDFK